MPRLTSYIKNLCVKPFWDYEGVNTYFTFWLHFSCYYTTDMHPWSNLSLILNPNVTPFPWQSRNFYVQRMTPKYLVGLKVGRTPPEFTVDILPYNSWSWGVVQNISQNPRIRLELYDIFFYSPWNSHKGRIAAFLEIQGTNPRIHKYWSYSVY